MTKQAAKKIHTEGSNLWAMLLVWAVGAVEALLLARLLARLLAARPSSPAVQLLYAITNPLVTPLRFLDHDQPPFGAALEFSTLALALILPLVAYLLWTLLSRRNRTPLVDV